MKLFKTIFPFVCLTVILSFCFLLSVSAAEKPPESPVLQYKLVNHDKISLKWTDIEGADKYYIYRQNPVSGYFNLRYTEVTETTATIGKLEAETEYSFAVTAVKIVDGKEIKSGLSNKVMLRTPAKWFLETKQEKDENGNSIYVLYAHHYNGSGEVVVDEHNLSITPKLFLDGLAYYTKKYNGKDYYGRNYSVLSFDRLYSMNIEKEEKKFIADIGNVITTIACFDDMIFIIYDGWMMGGANTSYLGIYSEKSKDFETLYMDKESRIEFLTINDMDGTYNFSKDGKIYFKSYHMEPENYRYSRDIYTIFRMNYDGTGYEQISDQKFSRNKHNDIITIKDTYLYYSHRDSEKNIYNIIRKDLRTYEDEVIFDLPFYSCYEKNGYLYINSAIYKDGIMLDEDYRRMKLDGSELTHQKTPFEWRY